MSETVQAERPTTVSVSPVMSVPSVVFQLNDSLMSDVDCRDVTKGNPGIGGADYLFVALGYELASRGLARVKLAHFSPSNSYPDTLRLVRLDSAFGSPWAPWDKETAADFVIVRSYQDAATMTRVIEAIPGTAPVIVWAHNHFRWQTLAYLAQCDRVRCVVYTGQEQAALAAGSPCQAKATSIVNGFYPVPALDSQPRGKRAVYLGNLRAQKGFHRLAKLWPRIHRECPDAALDVIGDARLYGGADPVGPMGLAAPGYEKRILAHLDNDPAKYGVVFHGKLGLDRFDIMSRSILGLPNPTGFTEVCPGSVLELSACGNAVLGPRRWGICDTVVDGVSGYLCTSDDEYVHRAVSLLKDPARALEMGRAGQAFVGDKFGFSRVCAEWHQLFTDLRRGERPSLANSRVLKGQYPLQWLRKPSRIFRMGALLTHFDRAHGWFLGNF
jgi:glycosyltransferase involved in cell wall biosynthesis